MSLDKEIDDYLDKIMKPKTQNKGRFLYLDEESWANISRAARRLGVQTRGAYMRMRLRQAVTKDLASERVDEKKEE